MELTEFSDKHVPAWVAAVERTGISPGAIGGPEYAATMIMSWGKTWILQSGDLFIPVAKDKTSHGGIIKSNVYSGVQINSLLGLNKLDEKNLALLGHLPKRSVIRLHLPAEHYQSYPDRFHSLYLLPVESYSYHRIELPGSYDKWFSRPGVSRQNIRRAEKEGVTVKIGGAEFLDDFYRLFLCSFDRWKNRETARQPHDSGRFKRILDLPGSKAKIAVARYEGKIISAAIFCAYKRTAAYLAGGSDFEYQNKRAGNLLHSEIIRFLIDDGISEYNLGMSLDIKSLERFKESLGAEKLRTVILERHRFPRLKRIYHRLMR
jgi:hypothetical protein